ncbi:MAG: glutathione S-transferase family protein [Proteobacteria bacterium]|nr:glutathione S-transferase family protein [Pseudomonadota bacterium]
MKAYTPKAIACLSCFGVVQGRLNRSTEADLAEAAKGEERFHRFSQVLERHLKGREWLAGDAVTWADFSVGSFLDLA